MIVLLSAMIIILAGCTTRYSVNIDALKSTSWSPGQSQTFRLVNTTPEIDESDLFFQEVSRRVTRALSEKGYRASDSDSADLLIEVNAHLSEPMTETVTRSDPVYFDSPGRTRVIATPVVDKNGKLVRYVYSEVWYPGRRHLAGYNERSEQITVFDKRLELKAYEQLADGRRGGQAWRVDVALRNRSSDLRGYLPYMLAAALPYIGDETSGQIQIQIAEDDPLAISLGARPEG